MNPFGTFPPFRRGDVFAESSEPEMFRNFERIHANTLSLGTTRARDGEKATQWKQSNVVTNANDSVPMKNGFCGFSWSRRENVFPVVDINKKEKVESEHFEFGWITVVSSAQNDHFSKATHAGTHNSTLSLTTSATVKWKFNITNNKIRKNFRKNTHTHTQGQRISADKQQPVRPVSGLSSDKPDFQPS